MIFDAASLEHADKFCHAFAMIETLGINISDTARAFVRLALAGAALLLVFQIKAKSELAPFGLYLYTIAASYILLMSPGTERNTYALFAPVLGIFLADAFHPKRRMALLFTLVPLLMFQFSYVSAKAYPGTILTMLKPIATCLLTIFALQQLRRKEHHWGV